MKFIRMLIALVIIGIVITLLTMIDYSNPSKIDFIIMLIALVSSLGLFEIKDDPITAAKKLSSMSRI